MLEPTFAGGFGQGLNKIAGKTRQEQNQARISELVDLFHYYPKLDKETVAELVEEVYRYFKSNCGAFFMAGTLQNVLEQKKKEHHQSVAQIEPMIKFALLALADQMCRNLDMASQLGKQAGNSMEVAYWVATEINRTDHIAAKRLLRTCGKMLSGPEVDQFFWDLKKEAAGKHVLDWAILALTEGMLKRENPVERLSSHLLKHGRGPDKAD